MPIKVEFNPDAEGFPASAKIFDGNKRIDVIYDKDSGFIIKGSRRHLTPEILSLLKLIYPAQQKIDFSIPQPLQTVAIEGGVVLLFDDFESLLKWGGTATIALDNTQAYNGSQSLSVTVADGATQYAQRYFAYSNSTKKYRVEFFLANHSFTNLPYIDFDLQFNTQPVGSLVASMRIYQLDLYLINAAGVYNIYNQIEPQLPEHANVQDGWNKIALEVDLAARRYNALELRQRFDISALPFYENPAAANASTNIIATFRSANAGLGSNDNFWIDDFKVLEL